MQYSIKFALLIFLVCSVFTCRKGNSIAVNPEICFTIQHHDQLIPNCTVYVAYNPDRFPGYENISAYDKSWTSDGNARLCIYDMPVGKHWFMATSYDPEWEATVFGSMYINVEWAGYQTDTIFYVTE